MNIDQSAIDFILDFHKNPKFWHRKDWNRNKNMWRFNGLSKIRNFQSFDLKKNLVIEKKMNFISNDKISQETSKRYYVIGKGYP